jgi:hypothetical protein
VIENCKGNLALTFRDSGNIGYTKHRTKTKEKKQKQNKTETKNKKNKTNSNSKLYLESISESNMFIKENKLWKISTL